MAAQRDTLNSTKPNVTNCLITEDPSLMFSIVKVACDQRVCHGLSSLTLWGGKIRDPGNEVGKVQAEFLVQTIGMVITSEIYTVS